MILNEKQYKITQAQAAKFRDALRRLDDASSMAEIDPRLLVAQRAAAVGQLHDLEEQLEEYEKLKSGALGAFETQSLRDLPEILIKARIARNWTQRELADLLGMKEQQVQRYEAEEYRTANLSTLVEIADALGVVISKRAELGPIRSLGPDVDWKQFPIREMYRRGWFEDFMGTPSQARAQASTLVPVFLKNTGAMSIGAALNKQTVRSTDTMDAYALLAWRARVVGLARKQQPKTKFDVRLIDDAWLRELLALSTSPDGPRLAGDFLLIAGIHFVIEPRLPGTNLDGAAIRESHEAPIVALTLRYDRLDNFWFVLLHEIGHIVRHIFRLDTEAIFDEIDSEAKTAIEREADEFAQNAILPNDLWEKSIARYSRTRRAILSEATKLELHPAIIAGRIRREANDYTLLTDMVGQGTVRQLFGHVSYPD